MTRPFRVSADDIGDNHVAAGRKPFQARGEVDRRAEIIQAIIEGHSDTGTKMDSSSEAQTTFAFAALGEHSLSVEHGADGRRGTAEDGHHRIANGFDNRAIFGVDGRAEDIEMRLNSHPSGRHFLQIPGPTNVPDRILRAMDYPTIDHRVPISLGGDHTWENVALACRRCNREKHDDVCLSCGGAISKLGEPVCDTCEAKGHGPREAYSVCMSCGYVELPCGWCSQCRAKGSWATTVPLTRRTAHRLSRDLRAEGMLSAPR